MARPAAARTTIVVGSGSSGGLLAARLSADPERRVMVIEAGPDYPDTAELERWLFENVSTGYHAVASCRIGPASDPLAVVGQDLLVRGVEGLYVADTRWSCRTSPPASRT